MRTVEETFCPCQLVRSTPNVHTVHDNILSLHCTHANILLLYKTVIRFTRSGQAWLNTSRWRVVEWKSVWVIELIALSTFHPHPSRRYRYGTTEMLLQHHKPSTPVQKSHRPSLQLISITIVVMRHFPYNYELI